MPVIRLNLKQPMPHVMFISDNFYVPVAGLNSLGIMCGLYVITFMCLLLVLNSLGTVFIGDDFYMSVSTGIKQQRHHVKSLKLGDKLNLSVASIENILVIV